MMIEAYRTIFEPEAQRGGFPCTCGRAHQELATCASCVKVFPVDWEQESPVWWIPGMSLLCDECAARTPVRFARPKAILPIIETYRHHPCFRMRELFFHLVRFHSFAVALWEWKLGEYPASTWIVCNPADDVDDLKRQERIGERAASGQ